MACCLLLAKLTNLATPIHSQLLVVLQVLDRGEKIELLVDKTENLRFQVSGLSCHCSDNQLTKQDRHRQRGFSEMCGSDSAKHSLAEALVYGWA